MEESLILNKFEEFFRYFYEEELLKAVKKGKKSIEVDFSTLDKFDPELADELLNNPEKVLALAQEAIKNIDIPSDKEINIIPRFKNLPESCFIRIRNIRSEHIGKLICVDGIVRRASEVKPEIGVAIFQCPECGDLIEVQQNERTIKPPEICSCGRKTGFKLVDRKLFDARWIVIEEPFELTTGDRPGEISIFLKDDLTSPEMQRKTDPGNRVKVVGILKEIKRTYRGKIKTQMDVYLEAVHVEPTEIEWEELEITPEDKKKIHEFAKDPEIYEKLIKSIAPSIYGLEEIKEAILLQLFGGVPHVLPDGTRIRGDIHILLVGDPGMAKSQLLKYVSQLVPRAKYVSGKGTTTAGLTATVIRDEEFMGGWVLEAGAMVLCNKSIICIDEFDKMSKEDQIAMHEALEQQTISIAKASIVATLPAQVSVLAGANPKFSRFDPYRPIAEQIDIPETLLSRFDLKFAIRDIPDPEKDEKLAEYVIETRLNPQTAMPAVPLDFLRKYIAYARKYCKPKMTKEACERLKQFYVEMRAMSGDGTVAITLRQHEALMRLAEASAKVRLSPVVEVQDAERAIRIMKYSLLQLGYDYETGRIDIDRTEGTPSSHRSKIRKMMEIIEKLEKEIGKQIPVEDVLAVAQDEGIKNAEELLNLLKREGLIFEPRQGMIQKV
ncbi:MAG TPA: minichromosome maintenance protein MCM [Nanoarchaeota archaeon]|nr:minichromosome maintenance protein MCM [Nanoarchaeota archaeon]